MYPPDLDKLLVQVKAVLYRDFFTTTFRDIHNFGHNVTGIRSKRWKYLFD